MAHWEKTAQSQNGQSIGLDDRKEFLGLYWDNFGND